MSDWISLGGIWKNKTARGTDSWRVKVTLFGKDYDVTVFDNQDSKKSEKSYDFTISTRDKSLAPTQANNEPVINAPEQKPFIPTPKRHIPIETTLPPKTTAVFIDEETPF